MKPKIRQPSTWLVSPERCARFRDRVAKHATGRQRGAPVGVVKGYHQPIVDLLKKKNDVGCVGGSRSVCDTERCVIFGEHVRVVCVFPVCGDLVYERTPS